MARYNYLRNFTAPRDVEDPTVRRALVALENELAKIAIAINNNKSVVVFADTEILAAVASCPATTWTDVDCSSVIPTGSTAGIFRVLIKDSTIGRSVKVRENGTTPSYVPTVRAQVADQLHEMTFTLGVDSDSIIEYYASHANVGEIRIVIMGYIP